MQYMKTVVLTLGLASMGLAQNLKADEKTFVEEKLKGGRAEVEVAKMALTHGSDSEVKGFAQRLVNDHTAVNAKLEKTAKEHNLSVATDSKGAADSHMASLKGAEFDKAFVQDMVEKHRMGVSGFEAAEKTATNPELHALITSTLPTLREHLKQAESLRSKQK